MVKTENKYMFTAECDVYGFNFICKLRKPKSIQDPTELLEWIILHVKALQSQNPAVGYCVIKNSGFGYHMIFPDCKPLSIDEYRILLTYLPHDPTWVGWTNVFGRATLRVSQKNVTKIVGNEYSKQLGSLISVEKPQTIRIIYPDGKIMYRGEIEEAFGAIV